LQLFSLSFSVESKGPSGPSGHSGVEPRGLRASDRLLKPTNARGMSCHEELRVFASAAHA
jgi:hypothetical protein